MSLAIPAGLLEEARARLLNLHPEGFEESDEELAVYTDELGEERLRAAFDDVSSSPVEPGWEERWREFHRPVWVGPLWIGPSWEHPPVDAVSVVIDPGRAFGTGAHPTTRLCLEFLLERERGSLLDLGCGSGVLAIAGAKLGFDPVVALDLEESAIEAARRNARANAVEIEIGRSDILAAELPPADVAVANVNLAVVESVAPRIRSKSLVTAGYFHARQPRLSSYVHRERKIDGGWAADLFEPQ